MLAHASAHCLTGEPGIEPALAGVLAHRGLLAVRSHGPAGRVCSRLVLSVTAPGPVRPRVDRQQDADSDRRQAASRTYGPSTGPCQCCRHARHKPPVRPAGGLVSQVGSPAVVRWQIAGSAAKCWPADGFGKARASGRARVVSGPAKAAGALRTGAGRRYADSDADGPRAAANPAGLSRDSDPVAPTTRQVTWLCHSCSSSCWTLQRGPLQLDIATRCSTCNPCIQCTSVCVPSQASKRTLLALLICSIVFSNQKGYNLSRR